MPQVAASVRGASPEDMGWPAIALLEAFARNGYPCPLPAATDQNSNDTAVDVEMSACKVSIL